MSEEVCHLESVARSSRPVLGGRARFVPPFFCIGLALWIGYESYYRLLGPNLHVVEPGRVYRCAQLDGAALAKVCRERGIHTVINLRGVCDPWPWYWEEARTTHALAINQEDVSMSAGRMPSVVELNRLVEIIDRAEPPLLFHCRHGADRTGLVSAIIRLLLSDDSLAAARKQLGPYYGHLAIGRPACLDRFFDLYAKWLAANGNEHSPALLKQWLKSGYKPDECWARLDLLQAPARIPVGKSASLRVRCTNASEKAWKLCAGATAGVHARYVLRDPEGVFFSSARAGLFNALVAPSEHIDLTLVVPPLGRSGKYSLFVDMVDEQQGWFFQMGSEPLVLEFNVE